MLLTVSAPAKMQNPTVRELSKYFPDTCRALEVLISKQIWCSKPIHFNDPFDSNIPLEVDDSPEVHIAAAISRYKKDGHNWSAIKEKLDRDISPDCSLKPSVIERYNKEAKQFVEENRDFGVVYLSEKTDSILMWSHYGAKHTGVCICFKRDENNELGIDDACSPVRYSDVYPKPVFSQLHRLDGSLSFELLYTKARDWAYEKEWRLHIEGGDTFVGWTIPVTRVILGCEATAATEVMFLRECKTQSIPLYRAGQVPGEFKLELVSVFAPCE